MRAVRMTQGAGFVSLRDDAELGAGASYVATMLGAGDQGVRVDAEHNEQLMIYALGALEQFGMLGDFTRVRLVIHQPRLNHLSEWDCSVDELLAFGEDVRLAAQRAREAFDLTLDQLAEAAQPGEKTCQWCRAKATCPKLAAFVQEQIGADFESVAPIDSTPAAFELLKPDTLGAKMRAVDLIEDWCRAVRAEVERRLLAGTAVDGFKLVEGKKGARAWTDEESAEDMIRKQFRTPVEQAYSMKLISPAQAEKLFKTESPKRWTKLQTLITQHEGKPSVAPQSDKRPALVFTSVADDFDDLTALPNTDAVSAPQPETADDLV